MSNIKFELEKRDGHIDIYYIDDRFEDKRYHMDTINEIYINMIANDNKFAIKFDMKILNDLIEFFKSCKDKFDSDDNVCLLFKVFDIEFVKSSGCRSLYIDKLGNYEPIQIEVSKEDIDHIVKSLEYFKEIV